jgi:hypothetical protein
MLQQKIDYFVSPFTRTLQTCRTIRDVLSEHVRERESQARTVSLSLSVQCIWNYNMTLYLFHSIFVILCYYLFALAPLFSSRIWCRHHVKTREVHIEPRIREQEFGNQQGEDFIEYRKQQETVCVCVCVAIYESDAFMFIYLSRCCNVSFHQTHTHTLLSPSQIGRFFYRFPTGESGADVFDRTKQVYISCFSVWPRVIFVYTYILSVFKARFLICAWLTFFFLMSLIPVVG